MRELKFLCGCELKEQGLKLCESHLAMYDITTDELKHGFSQKRYLDIVHALNVEEQERKELNNIVRRKKC